jgi:hypothetical protein
MLVNPWISRKGGFHSHNTLPDYRSNSKGNCEISRLHSRSGNTTILSNGKYAEKWFTKWCINSEKWLAIPCRLWYWIGGRNRNFAPEFVIYISLPLQKVSIILLREYLRCLKISTSLQRRDFHSVSGNLYKLSWTKALLFYITFNNLNRTDIRTYCRVQ